MAKKQKKEVEKKAADPRQIGRELIKKHGSKLIVRGDEFIKRKEIIVSVSPAIDVHLGGGIPQGSNVLLAGKKKVGKTVTSLSIAANGQKHGMNVYFLNIEGRLKKRDVTGIKGLDAKMLYVIGSFKEDDGVGGKVDGKILTGEEWLSIAEHWIHEDPGCIIILDSVSQLATEKEMNADIGDRTGDGGFRLLAQFTKRNANTIPVQKCIVIGIQHVLANTNPNTSKYFSTFRSGGNKVGYAVDVDLECVKMEPWRIDEKDKESEQIGQKITWKTGSTAITAPGRKMISMLRYGTGLDRVAELFELGTNFGLIDRNGAWYTLVYMSKYTDVLGMEWETKFDKKKEDDVLAPELSALVKRQVFSNILGLLYEKPEYADCLEKEIQGLLGYESN